MLKTGAIAATAAAVLGLAAAGPASAAGTRNQCPGMAAATSTVGTTDFVVHYNSASVDAGTATGLANDAQNGRNLELNPPYTFPAPPSDSTVIAPRGQQPRRPHRRLGLPGRQLLGPAVRLQRLHESRHRQPDGAGSTSIRRWPGTNRRSRTSSSTSFSSGSHRSR